MSGKNNLLIKKNKKAWNNFADHFFGAESLPYWYVADPGKYKNLINPIKNRVFLELACGSGHSLNYLLKRGARLVYGLDFSEKQIEFSKNNNKKYIESGKLKLLCQAMEDDILLKNVDVVFSIYGFGWTQDPAKVLKNIYKILKPGGKFIWSWDHPICSISSFNHNGVLEIKESYHDSKLIKFNLFGEEVCQLVSSISWWTKVIKKAGFTIVDLIETGPDVMQEYNDYNKIYAKDKIKKVPASMIWVLKK